MTTITIQVENRVDAFEILESLANYQTIVWKNDTRIADLKVDAAALKATITQSRNNVKNIRL